MTEDAYDTFPIIAKELLFFFLIKWPTCFVFTILKQYGEIEDCQIDENNLSAVITYKSRAEAEQVTRLYQPYHTLIKPIILLF